jgi:hypothetical protein
MTATITLDMYAAALIPAECKRLVACGNMPDQPTCESSLRPYTGFFETMSLDVASGKVIYDAQAAGACIGVSNQITSCKSSQSAPLVLEAADACQRVLTGAVSTGGACFFNQECVSGSCDTAACTMVCCAGTCRAVPAPVPDGSHCDIAQALNGGCAPGSVCFYDGNVGASSCVAVPDMVGAACSGAIGCSSAFYCALDLTTRTGTCQYGAVTGAPCVGGTGSCDDQRDVCDSTNVCTPPSPVGGPCGVNQLCIGYARCNSTTSTCQALARLGEVCSSSTGPFCLSGLGCDPVTGTCQSEDPPGPACM